MSDQQPDNWKQAGRRSNSYARYSGLAFQMLGTIVVFTYGGYKLDEWQQNKIPVWTLVFRLAPLPLRYICSFAPLQKIKTSGSNTAI